MEKEKEPAIYRLLRGEESPAYHIARDGKSHLCCPLCRNRLTESTIPTKVGMHPVVYRMFGSGNSNEATIDTAHPESGTNFRHKDGIHLKRLCSFNDGRSRVSRLSNMLPRVAEIIIDVTPAKLNERFEELKQGIVDGRRTDRGSTLSLPLTMSGLRIHHVQVCLFGQKGGIDLLIC